MEGTGGDVLVKKQWFIQTKPGKIETYYNFDPKKCIGSGSYGTVAKGTLKGTNTKRAIKMIKKSAVKNKARFKSEIDIMKTLDHPHVIKLFETFEDPKYVYLVMELCEGGELFDKIIEKGHFTESMARYYFKQIMQAINYCHSNKICHRDLKPENFLLLTKAEDSPLKVIDFGLSMHLDDKAGGIMGGPQKMTMKTKAGTPYYISPEVLKGNYDMSCDIWSSGVILYILLSGVPPFYGNTDNDIIEMVKTEKFTFNIPEFKVVSDSAKDLIVKMITKPEKRLKSSEVLEHPWLKEEIKGKDLKLNFSVLKTFQNSNKLKKIALTYIASQLNENEITELGQVFKSLDKNNDGVLTIEEIKNGLVDSGKFTKEDIQKVLSSLDTDASGAINYTEFLAATIEKSLYLKEDKLYMAFKMFDVDGSGKISASELKEILGNIKPEYWEQMIKEADKNGDGEIDYSEFAEMMSKI